jgi:hypothetical protein
LDDCIQIVAVKVDIRRCLRVRKPLWVLCADDRYWSCRVREHKCESNPRSVSCFSLSEVVEGGEQFWSNVFTCCQATAS